MFKQVIKYFLSILFLINSSLFAQTNESADGQSANMPEIPGNPSQNRKSINEIYSPKSFTFQVQAEIKFNEEISRSFIKQNYEIPSPEKKEESVFNILSSSYRNNIHFGGFWNKYAIVNFSPSVFIKPLYNVSLYAKHNFSCFIPIEGIKEHVEMLCIQGAAIMAVDNSIKILFGPNKMIPSIAGFVLKTLIINTVMGTINKDKKNKILDYRNYYYSVSIRF
jgi:hypothetical protein